uniref:Uncharacterized protein n=1 Tax=Arion vulgaris TaxID=1028688 RepID=A0A0B7A876_9EUPU
MKCIKTLKKQNFKTVKATNCRSQSPNVMQRTNHYPQTLNRTQQTETIYTESLKFVKT